MNPSPQPAGPPGSTPYPYPLLLSMLVNARASEFWMRVPSVLAILATGLLLALLAGRRSRLAALAASGCFLFHVLALAHGRMATPEALAALLGVAGFATVRLGTRQGSARMATAGLLLGLSLLVRPWAALGPVLGSLMALREADSGKRHSSARPWVYLLGVALLVASSQLILSSLFHPGATTHWAAVTWRQFPGSAPPLPVVAAGLVRGLAALWPLALLGVLGAVSGAPAGLDSGSMTWLLLSVLLRLLGTDEGERGLISLAGLSLAAGGGASILQSWCREAQWKRPRLAWALGAILLLALAIPLLPTGERWLAVLGGGPTLYFTCGLWAVTVFLTAGRQATPQLKWVLCLVSIALALGLEGRGAWQAARSMDAGNGYRRLSVIVRPELERVALDATALVAADPEAMEFYCYRRGVSWASLGDDWTRFLSLADGRHARVFVVRPSGAGMESRALDWLVAHKLELAAETLPAGSEAGALRVFVDAAPRLPPLGPSRPPGIPEKKAIIHPPLPERRYRRL